jgi:hypothetical protein
MWTALSDERIDLSLELPGLASADIFGTESHRMYKQIFVSQI